MAQAAREKKFERKQEAARLRAKERKRLNMMPPPKAAGAKKGKKKLKSAAAASAANAAPVAKKSVAPPPPPPAPKNMETFSVSSSGAERPPATNPKKSFARKYENQMSSEVAAFAADSSASAAGEITANVASGLETNEAEISAELDPFAGSTEPMSSPPPVVTSTVSSSFDFMQSESEQDQLPPPHTQPQVGPQSI